MRTHAFALVDVPEELELEVNYSYYYAPGVYHKKPEDCYPEEEEAEAEIEGNWQDRVMAVYIKAGREAIKNIESQLSNLVMDGKVNQWATEDAEP